MPQLDWNQQFIDSLFAPDPRAALQVAHQRLKTGGYAVLGYHGTNLKNAKKMVPDKLDPRMAGTGAGLARGPGFYIAGSFSLAADYAEETTQDGDPNPRTFEVPRKAGDAGKVVILRVYGLCLNRNFVVSSNSASISNSLEPQDSSLSNVSETTGPTVETGAKRPLPSVFGGNTAWGLQSSSGDPNKDKRLPGDLWPASFNEYQKASTKYKETGGPPLGMVQETTGKLFKEAHDLEIVVSSGAYAHLVVIPSIAGDADRRFLGNWGAHDDATVLTLPFPKYGIPRNNSAPASGDMAKLDFSKVTKDLASSDKPKKLGGKNGVWSQEAGF